MNKLILILIMLLPLTNYSQNDSIQYQHTNEKINLLNSKLEQVISNQINYKIEKDLLKETYSNNYSLIQTIITIVLGLISILGFIGIRSIRDIKKKYEAELNNLRKLKLSFQNELKEFGDKVSSLDNRIKEIDDVNQGQETKFKILEIKEKAQEYLDNHEFLHALEYINIGLDLEKSNTNLLYQKAFSYFKLGDFNKAIKINEKILLLDKENITSITDLAELYLLTERNDDFKNLQLQYSSELKFDLKKPRTIYFETLYQFNIGNEEFIKEKIKYLLDKLDENENKEFLEWDFNDVWKYLENKDKGSIKNLFAAFIFLVSGEWSKNDYSEM